MSFLHSRLRHAGMKVFWNKNIRDNDYIDSITQKRFYQRWSQTIRSFLKWTPPPHTIIFHYPEQKPHRTIREACSLLDIWDGMVVDEREYCTELEFYGHVRFNDPDNVEFFPTLPAKGNDFYAEWQMSNKEYYKKAILEPMMRTTSFKRTFQVNWSYFLTL